MERLKAPPDMTGAKVVYTERQGRLRYTYYDNNVVKITRYKRKSRIRWNRVIIALIVLVLAAYAVAHLIGFVASAVAGKKKESSGKEFIFESSAAETAAPVQTTAPPETAPAVTESVPDADTSSAAEEPEVKRLRMLMEA